MAGIDRVTSTDYRRPHRSPPVAAVNRVGRALGRFGFRGPELGERSLVAAARRKAGLDLARDGSYREPLRALTRALETEARLHLVGRAIARGNIVRLLANRFCAEADLERHPEALAGELEPPVVIVGLQRTGTTLVHRLLALDPAFRFLTSWEALNPARPRRAANGAPDPRVRFARLAERSVPLLGPDFHAIHPVAAESPEEDCLLMDLTVMSQTFEATLQVPSYAAWLERQDHGPVYERHARMLRYLHWQRPGGRWLLKTPAHLEHLDALLAAMPGARFLFTHRDPATCIASFASMMCHAYGMFTDEVDPTEVGRRWLRKDARMMDRALEVRRRVGDEAFLDLSYYDLVASPIDEIRRVYAWLGMELSPALEARMRSWLAENRQHKHGRHRYELSSFGLRPEQVEERFGAYRRRFDLPHE